LRHAEWQFLNPDNLDSSLAVRILPPMADESIPDQLSDHFSSMGWKGGVARAKALTPEQRKASATKASKAAAKKRLLAAKKKSKPKK
jgi:hypothetical protein